MTGRNDALVADLRRCLDDVSTEMRARGRDDSRFVQLAARLEALAAPAEGGRVRKAGDVSPHSDVVLLADMSSPPAASVDVETLRKFLPLARWVANCAGHGINSGMRAQGENLIALIDSAGGAKDDWRCACGDMNAPNEMCCICNQSAPQPDKGDGVVAWINSAGGQITPSEHAVLAATHDVSDYRPLIYGDTRPASTAVVPFLTTEDNDAYISHHGSICVDWDDDPKRQLSIMVRPDGRVLFAAYVNSEKFHGGIKTPVFWDALRALSAAPAAPKGGVVDEAMVDRAAVAFAEVMQFQDRWPDDYDNDQRRDLLAGLTAALTAALATQEQTND